jgi:hypothetical protein
MSSEAPARHGPSVTSSPTPWERGARECRQHDKGRGKNKTAPPDPGEMRNRISRHDSDGASAGARTPRFGATEVSMGGSMPDWWSFLGRGDHWLVRTGTADSRSRFTPKATGRACRGVRRPVRRKGASTMDRAPWSSIPTPMDGARLIKAIESSAPSSRHEPDRWRCGDRMGGETRRKCVGQPRMGASLHGRWWDGKRILAGLQVDEMTRTRPVWHRGFSSGRQSRRWIPNIKWTRWQVCDGQVEVTEFTISCGFNS